MLNPICSAVFLLFPISLLQLQSPLSLSPLYISPFHYWYAHFSSLSLLRIYLLCICLAFTFLPSNLYLPVKFPSIHMNIHTIFGLYVYLLCPSPCLRALLNAKFHFHVKIERFLDFICSNFTSAFFKFLCFEILKIGLGICINFNVV